LDPTLINKNSSDDSKRPADADAYLVSRAQRSECSALKNLKAKGPGRGSINVPTQSPNNATLWRRVMTVLVQGGEDVFVYTATQNTLAHDENIVSCPSEFYRRLAHTIKTNEDLKNAYTYYMGEKGPNRY
jgi:hypothetical protein